MALVVVGCAERAEHPRAWRAPVAAAPRSTDSATDGANAEAFTAASTSPVTSARVPSFRSDIMPVLHRYCASAPDCHGEHPTDSVHLDLRAPFAFSQLVGHAAQARRGAIRVVPGNPDASFLVDKIEGRLHTREGKPMPLDADTGAPLDPNPLLSDFEPQVLRVWIAAGAPNN